jgi:hypothetical protein
MKPFKSSGCSNLSHSLHSLRVIYLGTWNISGYNWITSTEYPSFCMTASSASLTALLSQSHDYMCYVSRQILTPPPRWQQEHTDLRVHDLARSSDLWYQHGLANVIRAWSWRLCVINPVMLPGPVKESHDGTRRQIPLSPVLFRLMLVVINPC